MPPFPSIVVTGLGAVAPNGIGIPAFAAALRQGKTGLRPLPFQHPHVQTVAVAACDDFDPGVVMSPADQKRLPRLVPMALMAAREAMSMAGLPEFATLDGPRQLTRDELEQSQRIGLILGTGGGGIDFTIAQFRNHHDTGKGPSLWTITNATHGNLAGELSIRLGLRGPSHCVSTGCASSSDAIGTAMLHLQTGRLDAVVVGGADAHLLVETLWPMQLLGVISTGRWHPPESASRPFDRDRDGFVLGEGAWFVVMERGDAARAHGAKPLATMLGYGATCDAYHRVRPDPNPEEAVRAIHLALEQADLSPNDIDYVQYHGTSTKLNDQVETQTIKQALGAHAASLPGSSIKSMLGHPQGACGAASVVATIAALRGLDGGDPFLPPTINLDNPDPACDLDYVANTSRPTNAKTALVNCLAFGAKNTALILRVE
ncbi:MAG: beta-ketoacyl-[acyl-carrier-protein] synthase family protein [Phycisphaeraceae bacterium]